MRSVNAIFTACLAASFSRISKKTVNSLLPRSHMHIYKNLNRNSKIQRRSALSCDSIYRWQNILGPRFHNFDAFFHHTSRETFCLNKVTTKIITLKALKILSCVDTVTKNCDSQLHFEIAIQIFYAHLALWVLDYLQLSNNLRQCSSKRKRASSKYMLQWPQFLA